MWWLIPVGVLLALFLLRQGIYNLLDISQTCAGSHLYRHWRGCHWYQVADSRNRVRWRRDDADPAAGERLIRFE